VRYFIPIVALLFPVITVAQISPSGHNAVRIASYPTNPEAKDPVFIFCNTSGNGSLTAKSPRGTAPFTFSWFRWDDVTRSFSQTVKTEVAAVSSSISGLAEGGYKVKISGGYDTSFIAWVHADKPYAVANLQSSMCEYVALKGIAAIDTFFYRNPYNGTPVKLPNGVRFLWSSNPASSIPYPDFELSPQIFNPPLVDVTYNLHVVDSFGCASESSFFYPSIHVKADFEVKPDNGEAPLEVTFTNKSVRGSTFRWEFGDGKDSISILSDPPPHIYYRPGEYSVKLTVESDLFCVDSMRFEKIVVEKSALDIPNVFTPDGDGFNDYFVVESKSLRYLSVEIFSQSGLKVYSFKGEGERLREWEGWDGNVNGTSAKASPGVYFYIIRAYGWDDIVYNSKAQRGFFYLFR
jgi:gliding motility-associated-like protein